MAERNPNMAMTTTIHSELEQPNRDKYSEAREGGNTVRKGMFRKMHLTPEGEAHLTKVERSGKQHALLRKQRANG
jgi:hypothetical protein